MTGDFIDIDSLDPASLEVVKAAFAKADSDAPLAPPDSLASDVERILAAQLEDSFKITTPPLSIEQLKLDHETLKIDVIGWSSLPLAHAVAEIQCVGGIGERALRLVKEAFRHCIHSEKRNEGAAQNAATLLGAFSKAIRLADIATFADFATYAVGDAIAQIES